MNPKKMGLMALGVVGVGLGAWFLMCRVNPKAGGNTAAGTTQGDTKGILRAGAAAGATTVTFSVGNLCLTTKSKANLLLSVKAVPTACAGGIGCDGFEQFIPVARDSFRSPAWEQSLSLDVAAVAQSLATEIENLTVAVSVCEDTNNNSRCDEKPLQQVARFNGRYLQQMDHTPFSMQFVSDKNTACTAG